MVTAEPVAPAVSAEPVAVSTPAEAPAEEPSPADTPASDVPVLTVEGEVERRTKRVVTAEPVAPAVSAVAAAPRHPPAASLKARDPGEAFVKEMAGLKQALIEMGAIWPPPDEAEEDPKRLARASPLPSVN